MKGLGFVVKCLMAVMVLSLVLSVSLASAGNRAGVKSTGDFGGSSAGDPSGSKLETNVKNTSVTATAGLGAYQKVNVGGIDVRGNTKGSSIRTNVENVSVNAATGLGSSQDVNFGGVSVK